MVSELSSQMHRIESAYLVVIVNNTPGLHGLVEYLTEPSGLKNTEILSEYVAFALQLLESKTTRVTL